MLQLFVQPSLFGQPIPHGVSRWFAIMRTSRSVSVGDLKRGTRKATNLRSRFWSNPNAVDVDSFEWVTHWPGTDGAGMALRISWPASAAFAPTSLADLLNRELIGEWEDLHGIDREGLLVFTVTHERMVAVRVPAGTPGAHDAKMGRAEPADPEFARLVQDRTSS